MSIDHRIQDQLKRGYLDSRVIGKMFFPERFTRPFDPIHEDMFGAVDNVEDLARIQNSDPQLLAVAAPRGIGKTSLSQLLLPTRDILFQEARYIVPISLSSDHVIRQSENLKENLITSKLIRALYGDIKTNDWSKTEWTVDILGHKVHIFPRGAGGTSMKPQQIRGLLWGNWRPDRVLVDDLEDPINTDSEEQRAKKKRWFYADVMNCIDRASKDWRIIVVGTILHEDSLLQNLMDNPDWTSISLEICDDNFVSNAPCFMNDDACRRLYRKFKNADQLDSWFREYRNIAVPTGPDAAFQRSYFKPYNVNEVDFNNPSFVSMVFCDIARTANPKSAESAVVGVSVNSYTGSIYVRDIRHGRWFPDELYNQMFDVANVIKARYLGVEVTGLDDFIRWPIKNEITKRGLWGLEFVDLHARGGAIKVNATGRGANERGKIGRIRSLIPLYRQGYIFHNSSVCDALEQQLLSFPRSKYWDIMDAFGYLPEMMEKLNEFMLPDLTNSTTGKMKNLDTSEDVYVRLEGMGVNMEVMEWIKFQQHPELY